MTQYSFNACIITGSILYGFTCVSFSHVNEQLIVTELVGANGYLLKNNVSLKFFSVIFFHPLLFGIWFSMLFFHYVSILFFEMDRQPILHLR